MAIDLIRSMLFPKKENSFNLLLQHGAVHHHLAIEILQPPHPLAMIGTSLGHKNRGVFAAKPIPEGEVLGEYTGAVEILPKDYHRKEHTGIADYLWTVEHPNFIYKVDAKMGTNELGMCNDYRGIQEMPNVEPCFIPHESFHYFCFRTKSEIKQGEELLVDYGEKYF